jgi:hypothetical protein
LARAIAEDALAPDRNRSAGGLNRLERSGPTVTPSTVLTLQRQHGNRYVQRLLMRSGPALDDSEVDPDVEHAIERARGNGRPLDAAAGSQIGRAMSADFSAVRVHTGPEADSLNRSLSARAFTTGNDIFFRDGEYDPGSSAGRALLAHELTHVVQQGGGSVPSEGDTPDVDVPSRREARQAGHTSQAKLRVGSSADVYEREADAASNAYLRWERQQGSSAPHEGQHREGAKREPGSRLANDAAIRRQPAPAAAAAPPRRGPVTAGGIDVRRIDPSLIDVLLSMMQFTAQLRRGSGLLSGTEPASIRGSGVAARIRTFLSNGSNIRRGSFDSGWVDDNGSSRFFNSWDYQMRVQITSIEYENPSKTGASGTHGSSAGGSTAGQAADSASRTTSGSVTGGVEGSAGGHEGAPGGKITGEGTIGQTNTETSGTQEGGSGQETFTRGEEKYNRYTAALVANYTISFKPGSTLGLENVHLESQVFDGRAPFGTITFDYTSL